MKPIRYRVNSPSGVKSIRNLIINLMSVPFIWSAAQNSANQVHTFYVHMLLGGQGKAFSSQKPWSHMFPLQHIIQSENVLLRRHRSEVQHVRNRILDPVYTMPVEIENRIKRAIFASRLHNADRILCRLAKRKSLQFCRFQILPVEFHAAFTTRPILLMLPTVLIVFVITILPME